jgi:alkylation response protein AidB-like acyl-CoA dehydrogenase
MSAEVNTLSESFADDDGLLVRSLDEALSELLPLQSLLHAAAADIPLSDETQAALVSLGWSEIGTDGGAGDDLSARTRLRLAMTAGQRLLPSAFRGEAFALVPLLHQLAIGTPRYDSWARSIKSGLARGGAGALRTDLAANEALIANGTTFHVTLAPGAQFVALLAPNWAAAVDVDSDAVTLEPVVGIDPGQGAARLKLKGLISNDRQLQPSEAAVVYRTYVQAALAEAVGAATRALELARGFALEREQFGRKIVSFQAVEHRLSTMLIKLEGCNALLGRLVASDRTATTDQLTAIAKHHIPAATREICESAIHVHGGAGFTWELGIHLFYRRVLDIQAELGGAASTLTNVAELHSKPYD